MLGLRWATEDASFGDGPLLEAKFKAADEALAKAVMGVIQSNHPQPGWRVNASHKRGIVWFNIPELMGDEQNWVVKISELQSDPTMKAVMRGAGELLERFRIPRSGFSEADFGAAVAKRPLAYRGNGSRPMDIPE